MKNLLTAQSLDLEQLQRIAQPKAVEGGEEDYVAGRVAITTVEANSAQLTVADLRSGKPCQVGIMNHGHQITLSCTCRDSYLWVPCRHRYAAALALREYLTAHPPKIWKHVLDQGAAAAPRRAASHNALLLFSLQDQDGGWSIAAYALNARHLESDPRDRAAVTAEIERRGFSREAKAVRQRVSHTSYPLANSDEITVANLLANAFGGYYYGSHHYEVVLPYLSHCLVFAGDTGEPLQQLLHVHAQPGALEAQLKQTKKGLQVSAQIVAGDQRIVIKPRELMVLARDPLWLLHDSEIVQVGMVDGVAAALLDNPSLLIPPEDTEEFFDQYLLPISERVKVSGDMIEWIELPPREPQPRLYLSEQAGALQAELRFAYGEHEVRHEKSTPAHSVRRVAGTTSFAKIARDAAREQELAASINSAYGFKKGTEPHILPLRASTQPIDFLLHQVPKLAEKGFEIFGEEALVSAKVNRNKPSISFKVNSGIDWFDVTAEVSYGDLQVALKDIRQAIKKREKFVKLADGSIGALPEEFVEKYRHIFNMGQEAGAGALRFNQTQLTLIDQLLSEADQSSTDAEFERRRERLRNFEQIRPQPLPPGFTGELRPYQKFGYDWLHFLQEYNFGGCLADDMGTGKTVSTLAFLESVYDRDNDAAATLIVMPRSLLFNWQREAAKFTPNLAVYVHADAGRITTSQAFDEHDLVLTTYGTMLRDVELLRQYEFHHIILDESQAIKNPVAETSKAARLLRGKHRLALTGTPIENSTGELWSQFAFLNPGLLGSLEYFRNEFVTPIERHQDGDTAQFLRRMVFPFILRRTKDQVAKDLPPRTEEVVICDMEPAQRKVYLKQRDVYRAKLLGLLNDGGGMEAARMQILEGLLRLRQISNHPRLADAKYKGGSGKFELLLETLETLQAEGHRALVFSQFVQMLTIVREALDARGVPYAYLDGQTKNRQEQVDRFQNDDALPFFLISLKAGGVGLNLTATDYVIHIDPWWNPAAEQQATDRTHRIGQDKPVFVTKLISRDTVEEKILQLQQRKRDLVDQIISAEGGVFKALTREDVELLFS
ncbi:MAG: DEAD/DEAH box helicase [Roseiflexaceae bacterium]|nr:DEAD/DEAH box helicase [Roseiflexaceae bacterium]